MTGEDRWHEAYARKWGEREREWSALVGLVSGISLGIVGVLIFGALPPVLTILHAMLACFGVGLLCFFCPNARLCREWREYHEALAANPVLWPWPRMPGDVA